LPHCVHGGGLWQTVRDRFYDPRHNGLDWLAVRERYLPDVQRATSQNSLARVINTMLSELHASHTRFYTPDEPEYYQLADIFVGALRRRGLQRAFPDGRISYPGIGIISGFEATGRNTITGVIDGTPAQQAGLRAGDEIIAADGTAFEPIRSFRGKVGKSVDLEVHRGASVVQIPVMPVDHVPDGLGQRDPAPQRRGQHHRQGEQLLGGQRPGTPLHAAQPAGRPVETVAPRRAYHVVQGRAGLLAQQAQVLRDQRAQRNGRGLRRTPSQARGRRSRR